MRFLGWLITAPLLLLLIGFALENKQPVTLGFWLFDVSVTLPLSLLAIGLTAAGFLLGLLSTFFTTLGLRLEMRRLRKETHALAEELAKRPLPPPEEEKSAKERLFGALKWPLFSKPGGKTV